MDDLFDVAADPSFGGCIPLATANWSRRFREQLREALTCGGALVACRPDGASDRWSIAL